MKLVKSRLVEWYQSNGRDLPWRHTTNPYHILIAEMLLRRTTATAVARVYSDFINRFESPDILARSRISSIEKQVSTLGLQNQRAGHLKQTAISIVNEYNNEIPNDFDKLSNLPGVGRYVASAVLNFAFGEPVSMVDGNMLHFLSRVFGLKFTGPEDEEAWRFMDSFDSGFQRSIFYWSIIDLVGTVCIRRSPRCEICPLNKLCSWKKTREERNGSP
jgi:A/G-specific adenine glycosylase